MLQFLKPQPFRLQRIIVVGDFRIGRDHSVPQGVDNLRLHMVRQMAGGLRGRQLAPAVLNLFLFRQRVGDTGEEAEIGLEHFRQRGGGGDPFFAIGVGKEVQRAFGVQFLAVHVEGQPRHRLIKQAVPGGGADDAHVVLIGFQLIRQLVRAERPQTLEPRAVAGERRAFLQLRLQRSVVHAVQLQREEHQRGREIGELRLHIGEELAPLRRAGVLAVEQPGTGADAPGFALNRLVAAQNFDHLIAGQIREFALIIGGEGGAFFLQPFKIGLQFRALHARIKILQPPDRQIAKGVSCAGVVRIAGDRGMVAGRAHGRLLCRKNGQVGDSRHRGFGKEARVRAPRFRPRSVQMAERRGGGG